ncbi:glycosyltransferase family 1 protein [Candidatus Kaiserbacteria bacterium]|nr:glycosyltransferase family 1 protein [Candidatus Kaiserbacteria bacterium]
MKPTVHLAYTIPFGATYARRGIDKALSLVRLPPLYRSAKDALIPWQKPIRAPHSITYNLIRAIRARGYQVRLYNFYEHTVANVRPGDIFIGQPAPLGGHGEKRALEDDPASVTSRTIREYPSALNFLIMPYAHDEQYSLFWKDLLRKNNAAGGGAIFIGGKIWERDWETKSPFADIGFLRKVHLTAMGVDPREYPFCKKHFNQKGKRKYLYIGHSAWYKNTAELERIAERMPEYEFVHIGGGEVKGWKKRSNFAVLTPEYVEKLAEEFDIFVNTSTADPQATTILEQMCIGLAIACTPETGYDYSSLIMLSTHDTEQNVRSLCALQDAEEGDLLARARENRRIAEDKHKWKQFTDTALDFVGI